MADAQAEFERIVATDVDDHDHWDLQAAFAKADAQGAWDVARVAIEDADPRRRMVAAALLGHVADADPSRQPAIADLLRPRLGTEQDTDALEALVHAIGHTHDEAARPALMAHARRGNRFVRFSALNILNSDWMELQEVLQLFRDLTTDPEDMIRDWATAWLAWSDDRDPLTIEALFARVEDEDAEIRAEAIVGLLDRDDPRAVPLLKREVALPDHHEKVDWAWQDLTGESPEDRDEVPEGDEVTG